MHERESEFSLQENAHIISGLVPVPPIRTIVSGGAERLMLFNERVGARGGGVRRAQQMLDQALRRGTTLRTTPGTKTKLIYWDGRDGFICAFNREGNQVGYGHVTWDEDKKNRETTRRYMAYKTGYVVGSEYTNQGLGTAMMQHLEDSVALNNLGVGAMFFYSIQGETPGSRTAMERIIRKFGGVPISTPGYFIRVALKPEYYEFLSSQKPPYTQASLSMMRDVVPYEPVSKP